MKGKEEKREGERRRERSEGGERSQVNLQSH